ncbi:hypothetical protein [Pseudorhodoferax soli]|jgi:hypothetical protein|uniref:Uncharacterized protein n=1 Tax=Pseudorhodoferax soli TaxID=545864 RepID=A0A368Y2N9_9BURK|nr:hypothetical protein [Pseudorhodoferax soli]RCW72504.1 hypothetical protein DES41_103109 [Pseudorhodoferax soli]
MMLAGAGLSRWVARAHHADGRHLAIELVCRGTPSAEQFAAAALKRARALGLGRLDRKTARRRSSDVVQLALRGVTISAIRPAGTWERGD